MEHSITYLAGILDGEGCISIHRCKPKERNSIQYTLEVSIKNTDGRLIDWLKDNFGGTTMFHERPRKPNHKQGYEWRVFNVAANNILQMVLPYLIIKKEQAEVALKFPVGKKVINPSLREWIYQTLKNLKTIVYTPMSVEDRQQITQ